MDKLRHGLKRKLVQYITHALRQISSLSARQGSGNAAGWYRGSVNYILD
jgi:hypothetical protein